MRYSEQRNNQARESFKMKKKKLKKEEVPVISITETSKGKLQIEGLDEYEDMLKNNNFKHGSIPIFIGDDCFDSQDLVKDFLKKRALK
jgi:hypothetical protein